MIKRYRFALLVLLPLLAIAGGESVASFAPVPHGFVPTAEPPRGSDAADTGSIDLPRPIARVPLGSKLGPRRHAGDGDGPGPHLAVVGSTRAIGYRTPAPTPLGSDVAAPGVAHTHALARSGAISSFSNGLPPPSSA